MWLISGARKSVDRGPAMDGQASRALGRHPAERDHRDLRTCGEEQEAHRAKCPGTRVGPGRVNWREENRLCSRKPPEFAERMRRRQFPGRTIACVRAPCPGLAPCTGESDGDPAQSAQASQIFEARPPSLGRQVVMTEHQPAPAWQPAQCRFKHCIVAGIAEQPEARDGVAQGHRIAIAARHDR